MGGSSERGVVRRLGGSHLRTIRPPGRTIAHPFAPGMNKPILVMQRHHHRPSRNATGRQLDVAAPLTGLAISPSTPATQSNNGHQHAWANERRGRGQPHTALVAQPAKN